MTTNTGQAVRSRLASIEGLRGLAIVLVILSHLWTLVDLSGPLKDDRFRWIFANGNYAVSTFFLLAGYFAASSMMQSDALLTFRGSVFWLLRRVTRLAFAAWVLLAAVLIVSVLDETDPYSADQTRNSVTRVALFSWNWWAARNALLARADLGHLWYLSVYVQVLVALVIVFWLLRRQPWVLLLVLTAASAMTTRWRSVVLDDHDLFQALLKTTVRAEPMLWGATLGVLLMLVGDRYRRQLSDWSLPATILGSVGALACLIFWSSTDKYFGPEGTAYNVAIVVLMVGLLCASDRNLVSRALANRAFVTLGTYSLMIYIWHYPIFWAVSRHSIDWSTWSRVVVALLITGVASYLATRRVDRPLNEWLDTKLPQSR